MPSLFLSIEELEVVTGFVRHADQRKWLTARGWRFEVSGKGMPIVSRNYADQQLGAAISTGEPPRSEWKPNVAAIRKAA